MKASNIFGLDFLLTGAKHLKSQWFCPGKQNVLFPYNSLQTSILCGSDTLHKLPYIKAQVYWTIADSMASSALAILL